MKLCWLGSNETLFRSAVKSGGKMSIGSACLLIDMIMTVELTGKERTASEFEHPLARTGFRLDRIVDAGFNTFILESTAV